MFREKKSSRYRIEDGKYCIDLGMTSPNQLFDERDPAPFRERDLDDDAIDYIMGSLQELPQNAKVKIVLTFPTSSESKVHQSTIRDAIHSFFEHEDLKAQREINFLFRRGQFSLFVGMIFLGVCLGLSLTIQGESVIWLAAREGLHIIGWVAMWKPLDLFLYDWWPLATHRRYYQRLMGVEVQFRFLAESSAAA